MVNSSYSMPRASSAAVSRAPCASRIARLTDDGDTPPIGQRRGQRLDRVGSDDDRVAPVAEIDLHAGAHDCSAANASSTAVATVGHVTRAGVDGDVRAAFVRGLALRLEPAEHHDRVTGEQRAGRFGRDADAVGEHRDRRAQPHDHTRGAQPAPAVGVDDRSPTARDDERRGRLAHVDDDLALDLAERRLAVVREELRERHAGARDDEIVGVDERARQARRALESDGRLARAHQPDEDEMAARAHRSDAR